MSGGYYEIHPNEEYGICRNLFDDDEQRTFSFRLNDPGPVESWPDLRWQLPGTDRPDIVWTIRSIRLVSPLVKQVFTDLAGPRDTIQWLPAALHDPTGTPHEYWVPHFPVHHDVLDETRTSIGPSGLPIRWVLARPKLHGLGVLVVPHLYDLYVIHERIGAALAEAGATGYTSKPARSV
jgi:hypothetical protein